MTAPATVLIISAVPRELELIANQLEHPVQVGGPFPAITGEIDGTKLVLCTAGLGKGNAAGATAAMLERYKPALVINLGCCGAYLDSGLQPGDLALADQEIFADDGVMAPNGWLGLEEMGLPLFTSQSNICYNRIPLSENINQAVQIFAEQAGIKLACGRFATVSTCSGTTAQGMELARRYNVICENMEGAAVALMALRYRTPCIELRSISNLVEDRDLSRWKLAEAMDNAQQFLMALLQNSDFKKTGF